MRKLSNRCQSSSAGGKDQVSIKAIAPEGWCGEGYQTMRNFPVLLAALGGLTAFVIPAAAESNHGSCATAPAIASDTINLETIPVLNTPGPKSVKSAVDDECDGSRSVPGDRTEQEFGDSDD